MTVVKAYGTVLSSYGGKDEVAVAVIVTVPPAQIVVGVAFTLTVGTTVFTTITWVAAQPVGSVYEIVAVPDDTPEATPVDAPMEIVAELLVQVPPGVVLLNVVVPERHTPVPPDIAAGTGLTVNCTPAVVAVALLTVQVTLHR